MFRRLPTYILSFFVFLFLIVSLFFAPHVHAQTPAPSPVPSPSSAEGKWVQDQEVTFVGKTATRADDFLNWTLQNYDWIKVTSTQDNPLLPFFVLVRNTVYVLMVLFVMATAFIIIVTRGQNITIMRFVPRFIFVAVLVTLSFSLVQFIYQISDIIQGFLYKVGSPSHLITSSDLLDIAFRYDFIGYRKIGVEFEESAFISLLLVRLTAFTYYVMTGILLIRKIILWFFIIVSPVFPLLLFYAPIRNTAKIWIGEFFRWLLYGPLFALFLHGLVELWANQKVGIPLPFAKNADVTYPTAVNILLGGPGQAIGINNSVNNKDTFALYVVALLMLWVVILLPFLLLNIFLDYLATIQWSENPLLRQVYNRSFGFLNGRGVLPTPPSVSPLPPAPQATGVARALPFMTRQAIPAEQPIQNLAQIRATVDVMRLTNLSIPKMRDIARYESSLLSRDVSRRAEVTRMNTTLTHLANPTLAALPAERERLNTVREKLVLAKQKGDPLATSVLSASQVAAAAPAQAAGVTPIGARVQQFAKAAPAVALPAVNRVQQVSLEDYEEVRKTWIENYQSLEVPKSIGGAPMDREQWIKGDIEKINQVITLLTSADPQKVQEGMNMVANILPFLLIGGFSKSEVIAYLKAKLEAGKATMSQMGKSREEEETQISRDEKIEETQKEQHMTAEAQVPDERKKTEESGNK